MTDVITKVAIGGVEYPFAGGGSEVSAEDVSYDNTTSGMTADNVQDAIDEVVQGGISGGFASFINGEAPKDTVNLPYTGSTDIDEGDNTLLVLIAGETRAFIPIQFLKYTPNVSRAFLHDDSTLTAKYIPDTHKIRISSSAGHSGYVLRVY